ncbi:MAG: cellulase family glycosylhydrolase, partial [Caldilineales bacterium]|nr:cellulase family glycosylhydrolase [Caldilineales bacterium]
PRPPAPASGPTAMRSPDFGAQAFLWWRPETAERDLRLMKEAGFNWVKQWFAWQDIEGAGRNQYDWSRTDRIVDQVQAANLKLLVRISPSDVRFWAGDPPENADLFAEFAGNLAARYRGRIHAYQIWNEPNLSREWGDKRPDPAGYARLLGQAYRAIKSADPNAIVVTAGMAPTTADIDIAMYDTKFYREMYAAMGGNSAGYFDALGVHGAGYAVAPETDPGQIVGNPRLYNNDPSPADRLRVYTFRHVEDIRQIMVENGDSGKQIVILEFGWTYDPRPNSPYYWHGGGAGIDPQVQGDYLVRAYQWAAQNWPWVGLMSLIYMPDTEWTSETEQYYWSIMDPSPPGETFWRPAFIKLCIYMNQAQGRQCAYDPSR